MLSINQLFKTDNDIEYLKQNITNPKYKEYAIENNNLIYKPLNLTIVKPSQRETLLQHLFDNDSNLLGKSVRLAYRYITSKYGNIRRTDIENMMQKEPINKLQSNIHKRTQKSITATYSNQKWAIDLVDMTELKGNKGFRYIMNVIDIFSRKLWLQGLKKKDDVSCLSAFKKIVDEATITPNLLMLDNGNEFKGVFEQYCNDNEIKLLHSRTHSPNDNSVVERANQSIRKIIRAHMLANNDTVWYNILPDVEINKNRTWSSTIRTEPDRIYKPTKERLNVDDIDKDDKILYAIERNKRQKKNFNQNDDYEIGDKVIVKMSSLFSNVRRIIKEKNTKQLLTTYYPKIYTIQRVINSGKLGRKKYILQNANEIILTPKGKPQHFTSNEIMHYEGQEFDLDYDDVLRLNRFEPTANDSLNFQ